MTSDDECDEKNIHKLNNISPLRYPGGKTRATAKLHEILINNFNINNYNTIVSPFFGGGSFEFFLQNKYDKKLVVNDKFTPLYHFWKQIQINKETLYNELISKLSDGISKENFQFFRNKILNSDISILEQSVYYFIINRCSFSGATLSGGFSEEASKKRFTLSSINKIKNLDLNKNNIEFYNMDFEEFIKKFFEIHDNNDNNNINNYSGYINNRRVFLFLDPPYYLLKNSKLYGNNGDLHESFNHIKLYELLSSINNIDWMMTYNSCEYIRKLYKNYIIIETSWTYGMNKKKDSSEIVILSQKL
jgi:DNA adenine methylase